MANPQGTHIWYELLTTDPDAALAFYTNVVGWKVSHFGGGVPGYHILSAGEAGIGGVMALPEGAAEGGMAPGWLGYIGVDDVDASVAALVAAGGAVHMPATDLENVGRIAMVADPQGSVFYVMRGASEGDSAAFDPAEPGRCAWNELATADQDGAMAFYGGLFGWVQDGAMPMGAMGDYRFIGHNGTIIGAMSPVMPGGPTGWTYYFRVPDIDAAGDRATTAGATIMHGPVEVPGGDFIIIALDPQGARFALVGKRG